MKSILTELKRKSKEFHRMHRDAIKDIILFGSAVRGKAHPNDIDVLIIFHKEIDKAIEYAFRKRMQDRISVVSKTEKTVKEASFDARDGILFEGYSLVASRYIASDFGFSAFGLFIYATNNLSNTVKTRFYYALNGRGSLKGSAEGFNGIKLSDRMMAVPLENIEAAREFFDFWKLEYRYVPILIPERLARKSIIGKVR